MFQNTTDYRKKCILLNIYKKIFRKRTFNSMIIFHFTDGNSKSAQCISIGRISHSSPQKTRPHNNLKLFSTIRRYLQIIRNFARNWGFRIHTLIHTLQAEGYHFKKDMIFILSFAAKAV